MKGKNNERHLGGKRLSSREKKSKQWVGIKAWRSGENQQDVVENTGKLLINDLIKDYDIPKDVAHYVAARLSYLTKQDLLPENMAEVVNIIKSAIVDYHTSIVNEINGNTSETTEDIARKLIDAVGLNEAVKKERNSFYELLNKYKKVLSNFDDGFVKSRIKLLRKDFYNNEKPHEVIEKLREYLDANPQELIDKEKHVYFDQILKKYLDLLKGSSFDDGFVKNQKELFEVKFEEDKDDTIDELIDLVVAGNNDIKKKIQRKSPKRKIWNRKKKQK